VLDASSRHQVGEVVSRGAGLVRIAVTYLPPGTREIIAQIPRRP
jgi:hypothetical protein